MISCKRATELASKSMDQRLTLVERLSLTFHNIICYLCRDFLRQLKCLRGAVRGLEVSNLTVPEGAKQRVLKWVDRKLED